MRTVRQRLLAVALAGTAAFTLALLPAAPASAHSYLERSDPPDGATLDRAPSALHLYFSESIEFAATSIDIVDGDGKHHEPVSVRLARSSDETGAESTGGTSTADTELPSEVVVALPPLGADAYRVSWRTVSSDDLHETAGVLVFGVGQHIEASGWQETAPGSAEAALRLLMFLGLALGAGSLFFSRLLRRTTFHADNADLARTERTVRRVGATGALLTVVADGALLMEQLNSSGVSLSRVINGGYGEHWLIRTVGLVLLAAGCGALLRAPARRLAVVTAWAGGAVAILGNAWLGHAGASGSASRIVADAVHVSAVAVWAGTVLTAAIVAVVARTRHVVVAALRRFARPAAACVSVTAITGVYLASDVVGSVDAAILTVYGRVLLLKVAIVAVALVIGGGNYLRLRRLHRAAPAPRVALGREAVALTLAFAAAAVLLSGQPATEPQLVQESGPAAVPLISAAVGDLQESVAVRPNVPGRNVVLVQALDSRRPSPAPVTGVRITLNGSGAPAQQLLADTLGNGQWSAPVELTGDGAVDVTVEVHRQGAPSLSHVYRWVVRSPGAAPRPATLSSASLHTPLRAVAAGLAIDIPLIFLMQAISIRRRRRSAVARMLAAESDLVPVAAPRPEPPRMSEGETT
ncbi:MAG: copper resistance protein CopC [Frankiales bacterium]|nr:copper resistance protein CopC [Frankiales bacterium]